MRERAPLGSTTAPTTLLKAPATIARPTTNPPSSSNQLHAVLESEPSIAQAR